LLLVLYRKRVESVADRQTHDFLCWVEMVDIAKELLSIVTWCSLGDEMLMSRLMKIAALLKRCAFCLVFSSSSVA